MPRKKQEPEGVQLSVRVNLKIVDRADACVEYLADRSGEVGSRADVLREAIVRGLRDIEREMKKGTSEG